MKVAGDLDDTSLWRRFAIEKGSNPSILARASLYISYEDLAISFVDMQSELIGSYFAEVIQHYPAELGSGYLNVRFGESLAVLYIGCHDDERGWLYARRQSTDNSNYARNNEGWLPAAVTRATVKRAVPVALGAGYLAPLDTGDLVEVLYIGRTPDEAGWIYARRILAKRYNDNDIGWLQAIALQSVKAPNTTPSPPCPLKACNGATAILSQESDARTDVKTSAMASSNCYSTQPGETGRRETTAQGTDAGVICDNDKLAVEVQRINSLDPTNWRGILGMSEGEDVAYASTKYRQLMKILHPDKRSDNATTLAGGDEMCNQAFARVQAASDQLKAKPPPSPLGPASNLSRTFQPGSNSPFRPEYAKQTSVHSCELKAWCMPLLRKYSFAPILLRPVQSMQFRPWVAGARARKTFIADSTFMHHMSPGTTISNEGWVQIGVYIDNYLIAHVLGKNAGSFAGSGEVIARKTFAGMRFNTAAVMPMFRALPPNEQLRFIEHERTQEKYLSDFSALPAIMDLEQQYKQIDPAGLYKKSLKHHVRPQSFHWFLATLCDVGAELNFVIGWNAGEWTNASADIEFIAQRRFLDEYCMG